ncbi:MAG: hypothetical protein GSR78_03585 [Desulfurococcales archaeon]|nr:hypothetical protein [Desulfurococcales archaeon]
MPGIASMGGRGFREAKRNHLERLVKHVKKGLVDYDIAGFLMKVNMFEGIATTSSCSGRIAILYSTSMTSKRDARILEAWHDPGECKKRICYYSTLSFEPMFYSWVSLQAPVINFIVEDVDGAEVIVGCAEKAGMRRVGYRKYRHGGFQVWVSGGDKLHVTLPSSCSVLLEACRILEAYKSRLAIFSDCVLEHWPLRRQEKA